MKNNWESEFDKQFSSVGDLFSFDSVKDFIETQISIAREEGDNKLIKVIVLGVEKENKAYELGKLKGRAEMKAQCLAVIPEDASFYAVKATRDLISSL